MLTASRFRSPAVRVGLASRAAGKAMPPKQPAELRTRSRDKMKTKHFADGRFRASCELRLPWEKSSHKKN